MFHFSKSECESDRKGKLINSTSVISSLAVKIIYHVLRLKIINHKTLKVLHFKYISFLFSRGRGQKAYLKFLHFLHTLVGLQYLFLRHN